MPHQDKERCVVAAEFGTLYEATFAKDRLEEEGIAAFLGNENPLYNPGFFSDVSAITLNVMEGDLARAKEILGMAGPDVES